MLGAAAAALALIIVLLVVAPGPALIAGTLMISIYAAQHRVFQRVHSHLGRENMEIRRQVQLDLQQGLGALKELRVARREAFFLDGFSDIQEVLRKNVSRFEFAKRLPPLVGEM